MAAVGCIINGCVSLWLFETGDLIGAYVSLAVAHDWGVAYYMKKKEV